MHDPSFLAYDLCAPIPVLDRWRTRDRAEGGFDAPVVDRRTNPEHLGERVYPWWQLRGYRPRVGRWVFRFPVVLEVWHEEPGGADAFTVCRDARDRHGCLALGWLWRHRAHLELHVPPVRRVRRWAFDRCIECGRRFRWRDARFGDGGWGSRGVLHDQCHRMRHLRRQVADLAKYVRKEATETERWRVEYTWVGPDATAPQFFADLGVGGCLSAPRP